MSAEEREATEKKKRAGSRKGDQHIGNTGVAKKARKESHVPPLRDYDDLSVEEVEKKARGLSKKEIRYLRDYEKRHENRKTLVEALDHKLEDGS